MADGPDWSPNPDPIGRLFAMTYRPPAIPESSQVELVWRSGERCYAYLARNEPESITNEIRALDGICLGVVSGSGEMKLLPKLDPPIRMDLS